jgi:acetylornithine/succinyldiaminopimelate/putrescine aminotransferase
MSWHRLQALLAGRTLLELAGVRQPSFREPIVGPWFAPLLWGSSVPVRAHGALVWDSTGKPWLDLHAEAGALILGHGERRVRRAMRRSLARRLPSASAGPSLLAVTLQDRLETLFRPLLHRAILCSSPDAALNCALGLALRISGKTGTVTLGRSDEPLWTRCASIDEVLQAAPACVVVRPGWPPDELPHELAELSAKCRAAGIVVIADERELGLGRTGRWLAHQPLGLEPDLVVLGSSLAAGACPIGACLCTEGSWARAVPDADSVMSIFREGPPPIACAAALTSLRCLQQDGLLERARAVGERWRRALAAALAPCSIIQGVQGDGLAVAVRLTIPALLPAVHAAQTERLLVGLSAPAPHWITLTPPLNTPEDLLSSAAARLGSALAAVAGMTPPPDSRRAPQGSGDIPR